MLLDNVYFEQALTRISHEHCANFDDNCGIQTISPKSDVAKIYTMFPRGQSRRCHLLQYFGSKHRSIGHYSLLPKTLKLTPPELMRNTG